MENFLEDYNMDAVSHHKKEMQLVFFTHAMQHVARISRVIRQVRITHSPLPPQCLVAMASMARPRYEKALGVMHLITCLHTFSACFAASSHGVTRCLSAWAAAASNL